ncbi:MAG: 50S ribosomal protein L2 [Nanoarchaeota archaeon]|nr:50S ribosomal protein L2 [Nanoarchaeota archaeon]
MGKRIIQQRRGKGGLTYRVRASAFPFKLGYPQKIEGVCKVVKLVNSPGHSAPLAKIQIKGITFYNIANYGLIEGQDLDLGGNEIKDGNILQLSNIPLGSKVFNIESTPGDGGKLLRVGGSSARISKVEKNGIGVMFPSKKEKIFTPECRATIGTVAGSGRLDKPLFKAGKNFHIKKVRGKLYPRTSAVCMNVNDHPFGSGRGKNLTHGTKGKVPKLNAPPGAKVGTLRPRRTGRKKR